MIALLSWFGHVIEIAAILLFGWTWLQMRREGHGSHVDLVLAAGYGWMLEVLDLWLFGSYHYAKSWWPLGPVPLYIPLLWAIILHSSMALSDRTGLPVWAQPFLDGLLAVLIDLGVDAIAIRVGLWHWGIGLSEGWFGVPAGNLCAWMWVAAWYGAATRLVRDRISRRGEPRWHRLLIPLVAYAGLLACLLGIGASGQWLGLRSQEQRLWLFAIQAAGFAGLVGFGARYAERRSLHRCSQLLSSLRWNRWLIHLSFFSILWLSGLWREIPALLIVSGACMLLEWAIQQVVSSGRSRAA